ncbi:MAG: amidohydrolase [Pseudomonadota bacterium]
MNRRRFIGQLTSLSLAGLTSGCKYWPEQGIVNPCLDELPEALARHPLLHSIWDGLDVTQVWDSHVHLVGGNPHNGTWFSPAMDSLWHPFLSMQKAFYTNAACVKDATPAFDELFVARIRHLLAVMPNGYKALLFAFDWYHDEQGRIHRERSIFHIPNQYAARVAHAFPANFEWAASIHPYREDSVEALHAAVRDGARAVKWLPSAQGIDPSSARCDRFYASLATLDIPIICHAGLEIAVQGGHQEYGNPLRLRRAMDHGVRVVVAHCASDGSDQDTDQGPHGPSIRSYALFARMMDEPRYEKLLYGDISALTQLNRNWALKEVLQRRDWHPRLLNGSDYPLPGIMPLFSASDLANLGLLDPQIVPVLNEIRAHNSMLFDFASKRLLRLDQTKFPNSVFETRRFFERKGA